jgi:hypothetical protein
MGVGPRRVVAAGQRHVVDPIVIDVRDDREEVGREPHKWVLIRRYGDALRPEGISKGRALVLVPESCDVVPESGGQGEHIKVALAESEKVIRKLEVFLRPGGVDAYQKGTPLPVLERDLADSDLCAPASAALKARGAPKSDPSCPRN